MWRRKGLRHALKMLSDIKLVSGPKKKKERPGIAALTVKFNYFNLIRYMVKNQFYKQFSHSRIHFSFPVLSDLPQRPRRLTQSFVRTPPATTSSMEGFDSQD